MSETIRDREQRRQPSIRVHVNEEERNFIAFLLRRYRADAQELLDKPGRVRVNRDRMIPTVSMAEDLIVELEQAGT